MRPSLLKILSPPNQNQSRVCLFSLMQGSMDGATDKEEIHLFARESYGHTSPLILKRCNSSGVQQELEVHVLMHSPVSNNEEPDLLMGRRQHKKLSSAAPAE